MFKMSFMSKLPRQCLWNHCQSIRGLRGFPSGSWKTVVSPVLQTAVEPATQESQSSLERPSALSQNFDPEFVKTIYPDPQVTFNLAPFVDQSYSLRQLVKLGVDLSKLEENRAVAEKLLQIDFDKTVKPVITFLTDNGVHPDNLGHFLTENPFILEELMVNLQARIDYLKSKAFSAKAISLIISKYPLFLNTSFKAVDARLGFLVREYGLSPNQVRSVLINFPSVVGLHVMTLRAMTFTLKEELGFEENEVRDIVVAVPAVLSKSRQTIANIFDILHNDAEIPQENILKFPEVFLAENERKLENRLNYLKILKRNQFDPQKALFIPLSVLTEGEDEVFAVKYAKTNLDDYLLFLRTR